VTNKVCCPPLHNVDMRKNCSPLAILVAIDVLSSRDLSKGMPSFVSRQCLRWIQHEYDSQYLEYFFTHEIILTIWTSLFDQIGRKYEERNLVS
jgi:hypothetical protein